jgi:hypothetical protein
MALFNNSLSERLPRDHLRRCSGRWYREGSRGSCPDRWVSSKCRYRAIQSNFFLIYSSVDQWLRLLDIDGGICPNRAGRIKIITSYERFLKSCDVRPAVYKISMKSIASCVAIREDQVGEVRIWGSVEEEFVKDRDESYRVRLRADSPIIGTNSGIRNMVLVVGGIEIDPVPARREVNLGTKCYAGLRREANILGRAVSRLTHNSHG